MFFEGNSLQSADELLCELLDQRLYSSSLCASMDEVPLKIPMVSSQAVEEGVEITVPDYLSILQETEVNIPTSTQFPHVISLIL